MGWGEGLAAFALLLTLAHCKDALCILQGQQDTPLGITYAHVCPMTAYQDAVNYIFVQS